jgi:hypothetical protein
MLKPTTGPRSARALAATAHHEAGHAVASLLLKRPFLWVTIERESGSLGHVRMYRRPPKIDAYNISESRARCEAMCALAGWVAQRRFNKRSVRSYHAESDHERSVDWAFSMSSTGEIATARLKLWGLETELMIENRWPMVQQIAATLLKRRTLSRKEVERLLFPPMTYEFRTDPESGIGRPFAVRSE